MGKELFCGRTGLGMKASGSLTKLAVRASSTTLMATSTMGCGVTTKLMVMASISTPREPIIAGNGKTTNSMAKASKLGQRELNTRASMT
jgi:ABC-type Fe3+/spermidine/putrescine transport system ATPase subunit